MREQLLEWVTTFPTRPGYRDGTFEDSPQAHLLSHRLPDAIRAAIPIHLGGLIVEGSAGKGEWTHTPWVALLDQAVTTNVGEGYYVVYLLSWGCERLYLTIAQGCTELKKQAGIPKAKEELERRAQLMRSRVLGHAQRLHPLKVALGARSWRGKLYEPGVVVGAQYSTSDFPTENELLLDLEEALALYRRLSMSGGWSADDEIMNEAREERGSGTLEQAKRYRQHRAVERQSGHSKEVKKRQGTKCKGCDRNLADVYGEVAQGLIDAHHLTPLASLADGEQVKFDPVKDFAVLCPNCHRVIHRMDDPSDLQGLRDVVRPYRSDNSS
ncbi:MAG TPA: DUF3578 domain-containing protein [Allosphingosinicella sp.]